MLNYAVDTGIRPRFHANDHSLDTVVLDPQRVSIVDARGLADAPRLDREGGALLHMPSAVADFRDADEVAATYPGEIERFIRDLTGADAVIVAGPATLRFSERSYEAGSRDNSDAARLVHSDASHAASDEFTRQNNPEPERRVRRTVHHNIWRTFSPPPQDMPLALCDARTVGAGDIVLAEAAFDRNGRIEWSFEAMLFRHNPAHRWYFYADMTADEVLVFVRHDSDASRPRWVPHSAFTDPAVAEDTEPRASVEMRTIAYWFD